MLTAPFLNRSAALMVRWCLPGFSLRTSTERVNLIFRGFANLFPSSFTRIDFTTACLIVTTILNGLAVQLPRSGVPWVRMWGLRPPWRHLVKLKVDRRFVPLLYTRRILTL